MNYLMVLYSLKPTQLRSNIPLKALEVPSVFWIVNLVNAQSKLTRSMPRRLKDKLTCHICFLALLKDDFDFRS